MSFADNFDRESDWVESKPERKGCSRGCVFGCLGAFLAVLVIGVVLAVMLGRFIGKSFTDDPVKARAWLAEMIDCQIPNGYGPVGGLNMQIPFADTTLRMIFIAPVDAQGHIRKDVPGEPTTLVVAGAEGLNEGQVEQQIMQQPMAVPHGQNRQNVREIQSELVELDVGGRKTAGMRAIAVDDAGHRSLKYTVRLKPGVVCVALGPENGFDDNAFRSFLRSVKVPEEVNGARPGGADPKAAKAAGP